MRLVLVAHGGGQRGVGHVARALALADEALARGWRVSLAGEVTPPADTMLETVPGMAYVPADSVPEIEEACAGADVVHLDGYDRAFDDVQVEGAVMSSMADSQFGLRRADLVIDAGPSAPERLEQLATVADEGVLAGPAYVPLRKAVEAHARSWRSEQLARPSVLVVLGGTDPMGLTLPTVESLARLGVALDLTVVADRRLHEPIAQAARPLAGEVSLRPFISDLMGAAAQHALTVSAAGTSAWQFARVGAPMALVCAVPNQADNYRAFTGVGAAVGLSSEVGLVDQTEALSPVLADPKRRVALADRAASLVDGLGSWRIASAWETLARRRDRRSGTAVPAPEVTMRSASVADSARLLAWRKDPVTARSSRQSGPVAVDEHRRWLSASLESDSRHLLIAELGGEPVATVRWDRCGDVPWEQRWEVSITLAPEQRGRGLSLPVLSAGEAWLLSRRSGAVRLLAGIHVANVASRGLFERADYLPDMPADEQSFLRFSKSALGEGHPS